MFRQILDQSGAVGSFREGLLLKFSIY